MPESTYHHCDTAPRPAFVTNTQLACNVRHNRSRPVIVEWDVHRLSTAECILAVLLLILVPLEESTDAAPLAKQSSRRVNPEERLL